MWPQITTWEPHHSTAVPAAPASCWCTTGSNPSGFIANQVFLKERIEKDLKTKHLLRGHCKLEIWKKLPQHDRIKEIQQIAVNAAKRACAFIFNIILVLTIFMFTLASAVTVFFYIWGPVGLETSLISRSNNQLLSGTRESSCFCQFLGFCPSRQNQFNSLSRKSCQYSESQLVFYYPIPVEWLILSHCFLAASFQTKSMHSYSNCPITKSTVYLCIIMAHYYPSQQLTTFLISVTVEMTEVNLIVFALGPKHLG